MHPEEEFWKFGLHCKAEKLQDLTLIEPDGCCNYRIAYWDPPMSMR
jgi:hypothetical protein